VITLQLKTDVEARLAAEAEARGVAINEYAEHLIEERMVECVSQADPEQMAQRLTRLAQKWHQMPTLDSRTADQILGYDRFGLPEDGH
jgi:antitoxin VapB